MPFRHCPALWVKSCSGISDPGQLGPWMLKWSVVLECSPHCQEKVIVILKAPQYMSCYLGHRKSNVRSTSGIIELHWSLENWFERFFCSLDETFVWCDLRSSIVSAAHPVFSSGLKLLCAVSICPLASTKTWCNAMVIWGNLSVGNRKINYFFSIHGKPFFNLNTFQMCLWGYKCFLSIVCV